MRRVVVSSVAKSWSAAYAPARVMALNRRGFSGVGVAHQGYRQARRRAPASAPLGDALALDPVQPFAQHLDAGADHAAVHFQLRFAGPAHTDAATLALKVGPQAGQPRGQVLQLGQFDLQLAFVAFGAQREDIQDQARRGRPREG